METVGTYCLTDPEALPQHFGDVRPKLKCDYVAGVATTPTGAAILVGRHSEPDAYLMPLTPALIDTSSKIKLVNGHGDNLVRCICIGDFVVTGGEDNHIRAWKWDGEIVEQKAHKIGRRKSRSEDKAVRYQPY